MKNPDPEERAPEFVVAIGASAGGLAAMESFIEEIPRDSRLAFVLVQHLSPDYKSLMKQILEKHTHLPIDEAVDGMELKGDHVYVIPPGHTLLVKDGALALERRDTGDSVHHSIDYFLESLAEDAGPRSIAVILSGTGSDGSIGIRAVKNAGGLILVQDETAQFDGMPRSAIGTGVADFVLPPEDIARQILIYTAPGARSDAMDPELLTATQLAPIIGRLKEITGIDFHEYKRGTISRRIEKRMRIVRVDSIEDYSALISSSSSEVEHLSRELMVGVTQFFRDGRAFDIIESNMVAICKNARDGVVRIWVVGCSTGEEAYSLAILMEEHLAHSSDLTYKIFATDIDARAIAAAGRGIYPLDIEKDVSADRLSRFFINEGNHYRIVRRIRERIVFAIHNVGAAPPFTRMNLVSCRNLLIYQTQGLQRDVITNLQFALFDDGFLFLGPTETLGPLSNYFTAVDERWRVFRRLRGKTVPRLVANSAVPRPGGAPRRERDADQRDSESLLRRVAAALLGKNAEAAALIDDRENVSLIFGDGSRFLRIPEGQPTQNIIKLLRGDLRLAASSLIRRLRAGTEPTAMFRSVSMTSNGGDQVVDLSLDAVEAGERTYSLLTFGSVRESSDQDDANFSGPPQSKLRMEELEGELVEVKEHLQSTIEELESANEELQSTNEELIASNEELQSTNEELHSVNEELHIVNAEHQRKIIEQETLARDMDHLLETAEIASIFLDRDLCIRKYTPAITKVIPLIPQDIGRPVTHLKHDLEDVDLSEVVEKVARDRKPLTLHVRGSSDDWFRLRAVPYKGGPTSETGVVLDFVDITAIEIARASLAESEERFRQIAENIREVFWMRDVESMAITYLSPAFTETFGQPPQPIESGEEDWAALIHEDDRSAFTTQLEAAVENNKLDVQYRVVLAGGEVRWIHDRGFPIRDDAGSVVRFAGLAEDISRQKADEETQRAAARALEDLACRDPLTQLANRRGLESALDDAQASARRDGVRVAAILIDCDNFKRVNDSFGHAVGDVALQRISSVLAAGIRPSDRLGRIGGDEFLVILPGARVAEARDVAERLRLSLADTRMRTGTASFKLTASFGVGLVNPETVSIEEVIAETQGALKRGKAGGKNLVATHEDEVSAGVPGEEFDDVIRRGDFTVVTHDIYDIRTSSLIGYEYLSRGPRGALCDPASFFRHAIEANRLTAVDLQCLRNCLEHANRANGLNKHVNVYPSTLIDTSQDGLKRLFEGADETYCVELSEQQFIGDPSYVRERVDFLKDIGVRVAIDDVGFGRSSLETLIVLEPDVVKIDQSFVHGCATNPQKERSLRRLVQVARSLDCDIVAEGVETPEDVEILRAVDVQYAQGFLWGEPKAVAAGV